MNKLTITLIIAQNGLKTAAGLLAANAAKADAQATAAGDDKAAADKAKKKAAKARKLAQILTAADAGVASDLAEPDA
jgi:hypothetical protein